MIIAENVVKDYTLLKKPGGSFRALDNVSFKLGAGKVLGIIGSNGSGKSTLLKLLAGISPLTSGKIEIKGKASSILELATGFNRALSGRENVYRSLLLRGHSKKKIKGIEDEIVDFSELGEVIHQPVSSYSSGMEARLAFALITASVEEVLLVDELLVVGDEYFQKRSLGRIRELCESGRTVVLVSHAIPYVERLCDRVIWLEKGKIHKEGPAHEVTMDYFARDKEGVMASYPREYGLIDAVETEFCSGTLKVYSTIRRLKMANNFWLQVGVYDAKKAILAGLFNTTWQQLTFPAGEGAVKITLEFPLPAGLEKGLVSVVLGRGSGAIPESVIEDCWGWSDARQVYFLNPDFGSGPGYLKKNMNWKLCLSK